MAHPATSAASSQPFSTESYFSTQHPPASLADKTQLMTEFIERWTAVNGKKVVLVTSGGTTVPLEANTYSITPPSLLLSRLITHSDSVRFLDNFSAGTRGATSAEYFLSAGYAVIFLHRLHSLRPFSRHYSHSLNPFLDLLSVVPSSSSSSSSDDQIIVDPTNSKQLLPILKAYHRSQSEGTILSIDFQTVNEYLWLLKSVTAIMAPLGRRGMFYLAAAVSDFFLPEERVAEHKIQSVRGSLSLEMDQVPKVLRPLVQEWTPEGYIVSFKLETDLPLLIPKSQAALSRYGHQLVIGNTLHTRKSEVVFVERSALHPSKGKGNARLHGAVTPPLPAGDGIAGEEFRETWLRLQEKDGETNEIEELIIAQLVDRHERWIEDGRLHVV
ncbi:phosphopantothenate---cysteine ligase (ATP), partial [Tremellales sp. Uapishka_1]